MRRSYTLAPEAANDLAQIWWYIKARASQETADRVESVIREKILFLRLLAARDTGAKI
jgi:plasmid stabilization system protein ParE